MAERQLILFVSKETGELESVPEGVVGWFSGLDREAVREVALVDHLPLFRIKLRTRNQFSMPIYKGLEQ